MRPPTISDLGRPAGAIRLAGAILLAGSAAAASQGPVGPPPALTEQVLDQYRDLIARETLPFTIAQAVEVAQVLHPDVRRSTERLDEFPFLLRETLAAALPQLSLSLQAAETRDPGFRNSPFFSRLIEDPEAAAGFGGGDPNSFGGAFTFGTYAWNFQFSQTLWDFRLRPGLRRVDVGREIAELELAEVRNQVARDTAAGLYAYLLRERTRDVLLGAVEARERSLAVAEDRLELGAGSRLEVLRARVGLSRLRRQLQDAEDAVAVQRAGINATVGRDQELAIQVLDELVLPEPAPRILPPEALMELAGQHRPELRRRVLDREQLRLDASLARAGSRPEISANASYGVSTFAVENTWDMSLHNWNAGVFLNWTLFDGFGTRNRIAGIRSRETQSEWEQSEFESLLEVEIRAATAAWRGALAALEEAALAVEEAREAERVAEEERAAGVITSLVVLESAQVRREVELELATNTHDALVALAELKFLVGFSAGAPHAVISDGPLRSADADAPALSPPVPGAGPPPTEDSR